MIRPRIPVLFAVAILCASSHLACSGQEQSAPPATQNDQAAVTTRPVEYLEPAVIYQKLCANPAPGAKEAYAPVVTRLGHGQFDWTRRVVQVTGQAKADGRSPQQRMMAMRAAEVIAKRNALLVAADVPIDAAGRMGNLPAGRVDVDGVVRGSTPVRNDFDPATRTATVTMDVPMSGLQGVVRVSPAGRAGAWTWTIHDPVADACEIILIDARRFAFTPVLAPRLMTAAGQLVFQPEAKAVGERHAFLYVSYAAVGQPLPCGEFRKTIILTPAKADGGALVLTDADLAELSRHSDALGLLQVGRAVIVVKE
ncbi:MAG: hypothetical protein PHU85_09945 [Phycisphaerae bacterium]|nr:hypothetical protein [Phycisphaerae bacterium]